MLDYLFFRNAQIAVVLISIAAAFIGTYVVTRRMVSLAGGVTHACFGGLGFGYFLGINPLWPAMGAALAASVGVERLTVRGTMRSDSAIAVIWAIGMAAGVLFVFITPGYVPELNAFLFGNILSVDTLDLWLEGIFGLLCIVAACFFGKDITAYAFDADFARTGGLPVKFISALMTVMVSIGIVLTIRLVGVMLLMSMLALPPLTAELIERRYRPMMIWSAVICLVTSTGALWLGTVVDVPCSAFIVLFQVACYVIASIFSKLRVILTEKC